MNEAVKCSFRSFTPLNEYTMITDLLGKEICIQLEIYIAS